MKTKFEKGKWYKNLGKSEDYIGKFNSISNFHWYCQEYIYKNIHHYDFARLTEFFQNAIECTLEEIQQYLPDDHIDKIKSFSLESSWYIKLTKENFDVVTKWHKSVDIIRGRMYNIGSYYGVCKGKGDAWGNNFLYEGAQVITFEQFKQYVLKQKTMKTKQDFTIEGSIALKEAFVKESGLQNSEIYFEDYLVPSFSRENSLTSTAGKQLKHFILPQQWNEALEYVKEYFKEEEFKAGDYVVMTDYGTATKTNSFILGAVYKLSRNYNKSNGFFVEKDSNGYNNNGWSKAFALDIKIRKATSEEIKTSKYKEFTLGYYTAKVTKDVVLIEGKGKVTAREWLKLSEKFKAITTVYCGEFIVSFDTISIGCINDITQEQFNSITDFLKDNESNS